MVRERVYEVIEKAGENDKLSAVYDYFMMATILISLIPLGFKTEYFAFSIIGVLVLLANSVISE